MNVNNLKAGLFDKLRTDATLGALLSGTAAVYESVAPQDAAEPYVVFGHVVESDARTLGTRAWEEHLYDVKSVTAGDSSMVGGSIAHRIDQLLDGGTLTVSGATNFRTERVGVIDYPETGEAGRKYRHLGGQYRFHIQET